MKKKYDTELPDKERMFCDEYLKDMNGTRAYLAAYKHIKNYDTAAVGANRLLKKDKVKKYIQQKLDEISSAKIADVKEVMEYLTSVMRREQTETVVVTLNKERSEYAPDENGTMRKRTVKEEIPEKVNIPTKVSDANKAAELLGKRYAIFTDSVDVSLDAAQKEALDALESIVNQLKEE